MNLLMVSILSLLVSVSSFANIENFVGNYEIDFDHSSPNCPATALILNQGSKTFYTNLIPGETPYQIIGSATYPRTGEMLKVGYFETTNKYVQSRLHIDANGNHSILMSSFEASVESSGRLTAKLFRKDRLEGSLKPFYKCSFKKI